MEKTEYPLVIIGGGPAGLTAGLYAARDRLSSLLIEKAFIGGNINDAEKVENYPGFPDGIAGRELTRLMHEQATKFGLEVINAEVTGIEPGEKLHAVKTDAGTYTAKAVIIAGGSEREKLGVPGEKELTGRGVSYCATCDAPFFNGKKVAVVGGGNAAIYEALHLAKFASKVFVIHRRAELRATAIAQEKAFAEPKIEFIWKSTVQAVEGKNRVESLKIKNVETGKESSLPVDGVFPAIGLKPNTTYLKGVLEMDSIGRIITDERLETSAPGIFAAGDIRTASIRQTISAAGDGATAAFYAKSYIEE
jgi:thioredoxin reductase (NADPH)